MRCVVSKSQGVQPVFCRLGSKVSWSLEEHGTSNTVVPFQFKEEGLVGNEKKPLFGVPLKEVLEDLFPTPTKGLFERTNGLPFLLGRTLLEGRARSGGSTPRT